MSASFSREFRLAAACAMWPSSNRRTEAIRTAAADPLDWQRFLRLAKRHQLIGLVQEGLLHAWPEVPPQVIEELRAEGAALVLKNLSMAAELLRLQSLFDNAHLPILFVKGAALAMLAFGNLGLRSSQDIDLLVDRGSVPAATALILRAGYIRFDPPAETTDEQLRLLMRLRKDLGFVHAATGIRIELHWRLFLNPHAMAESSVMAASRVVPLAGTAGLRTMGEQDLFAYLCMHGALHWWYRLKWLADINGLLATATEDRVERLLRAAEVSGAGHAAAQALHLCRRVLGTPVPTRIMTTLGNNSTVRWLESTALTAMTAGQGKLELRDERFGTTRGSLSTFFLRRSWRYRLAELGIHLTNTTDVLTVPLPERLRFLYPVLRLPLWAWRHVFRRGTSQAKR